MANTKREKMERFRILIDQISRGQEELVTLCITRPRLDSHTTDEIAAFLKDSSELLSKCANTLLKARG